jgi:hypothetical protein
LHERAAANSKHFVWAESEPGAEMYRRMSVQSGNSVVLQWSVYKWIEMFKNGCKRVMHQGTRAATEGNTVLMACVIPKLFILRA